MAKERNHKDIMAILKATSKTIFDAVESGNINVLKSLLKSGANVEEATNGEYTPIMLAALQNEVDCVALLSDHGANVNARTSNNRTALYLASEKGCLEAVIRLLHLGAEVNTKTTRVNTTPLMSAAGNGHESIVELLLYHKADPTVKNRRGWTAAHYAADGKCKGILKLIESSIGDINTADKYGETPLVLAAKVCDHDTLKHLLAKQGKNISMEELCQALANAAMWDEDYDSSDEDCYKITKMIIDHQPEVAEIGGLEALKVALNDDHIETARLLLDHGANIDERGEDGLTLLMHTVEHRSPDSARLLLSLGADRSVKNNDGLTATDMAQYYSEKAPKDTRLQKVLSILKSNG
jgi:ankyrin repeat protein